MKKRILVIDDDEDILEVLNIILEKEGYQVILCNNGESAKQIAMLQPDLVMLDLRLSGSEKGGAEICSEIKSIDEHRHLPVMLISAEADVPGIAHECGANAWVQKPFDIHHLVHQVRKFVV